jgi:hypothetical protein
MPRWIGGTGSGGNDAFTKALLHFDGNLTDSAKGASAPHTWTNNGPMAFVSVAKFGQAVNIFASPPRWGDTPDSIDFALDVKDFTIDFWMRPAGGDGTLRVMTGQNNASGIDSSFYMALLTTNNIQCFLSTDGTSGVSVVGSRTFLLATADWHHIAFVRKSAVLRLFVDGAQDGSDTAANFTAHDSASKLAIGRPGALNGDYFIGQIDEYRMSVGAARWWGTSFPVPTRAYLPT